MTEAAEIVAKVFIQAMSSVSLIAGARRARDVLMGQGSDSLMEEAKSSATTVLALAESVGIDVLTLEQATDHIFQHQSRSLAAVVDSSSLITMHAVLDDALYELLRAITMAAPERCEHLVANKKVAMSEFKTQGYMELLKRELSRAVASLERASLLEKADILLSILKPKSESLKNEQFEYDRGRLERLDNLRHGIVHGGGPRTLASAKDDLDYMQFVLFTLWANTSLASPGLLEGMTHPEPLAKSKEPTGQDG